ncbi:MAG: hypothetical protein J7K40_13025 [candidate division Zixibacteria bacterium]|nr:hypothetical protein [candidate division Zixibacteria bacterium]
MNIYNILGALSIFSIFIPLIAGLIGFRKYTLDFKLLTILFLIITGVGIYSYSQAIRGQNNIWLYHFYDPIEYSLFIAAFSFWQKKLVVKKIMLYSIPVFVIFCIINIILTDDINNYNFFTSSISRIIFIIISAYTLLDIFKSDKGELLKIPEFWIAIALFMCSSNTLVYFVFNKIIVAQVMVTFWVINLVIDLIANQIYAIGFICRYRQQKYIGA